MFARRGVAGAAAVALSVLLVGPSAAGAAGGEARLLVMFGRGAPATAREAALARAGAREQRLIADIGVRLVTVPSARAAQSLAQLKATPIVEFAERDTIAKPQDLLPSDPSFPQTYAVAGGAWGWSKTHTTQAWDVTRGARSVAVAILDTGLKTQGLSDFDGQVVTGWNILNGTTDTSTNAGNHGTYVAGVVGLALDNTTGNAGYCPGCAVMPVQVGTDSGAYDSSLASGITWAADHGARVENLSWAGTSSSSTIASAVSYARSKGVVVVAAAGNSNCDCPNYPAATPGVIGVAGTDSLDNKQGDSNYGTWVKVAAPESNLTAWPTINGSPGYAPVGGTSLAAPVVAAIAGLLFSANSALSGAQVENALETSAVPVGFPVQYGRVDALAALNSLGFSDPQPSAAPTNTTAAQILVETNGDYNTTPLTGAPQVGQVLLRGQGGWVGSAPLSLSSVQWQRCDTNGANCALAGSITRYTVQSSDAGYTFRLVVAVKNNLGSTTAASSLSLPVGAASVPAPANTALPGISGSATVGQTLTASTGTWTNSPTGYAYQWQRCDSSGANCVAIAGATVNSYTLASADAGFTLRAQVTASNSAGSASAQSTQTAVVAAAVSPPANTAPPTISGSASVGQTLSASTGTWTNSPTGYAYQWLRCDSSGANCAAIAGATVSSYTLASADAGFTLRVQVTASNSAGSTSAQSTQTAVVASANGTQSLTFTGTLQQRNGTSQSFAVTIGAGEADATLSFSKTGTFGLQLVNAAGVFVAQVVATSSSLVLNVPLLPGGAYTYVVSGSGYRGSAPFTLSVTSPSP